MTCVHSTRVRHVWPRGWSRNSIFDYTPSWYSLVLCWAHITIAEAWPGFLCRIQTFNSSQGSCWECIRTRTELRVTSWDQNGEENYYAVWCDDRTPGPQGRIGATFIALSVNITQFLRWINCDISLQSFYYLYLVLSLFCFSLNKKSQKDFKSYHTRPCWHPPWRWPH